jgi:hypothetical protein
MDAPNYNGAPGPEHDPGRSKGQPSRFRCLDCDWKGHGYSAKAMHFYSTQHRIVWSGDSRQTPPVTSEVA